MKLCAGLVQLTSSDDPATNLTMTEALVRQAAAGGAAFVLTPEVTNIVTSSAERRRAMTHLAHDDPTLARMRVLAEELGIWLLLGSLLVRTDDPDGRLANRSFLIDDRGVVRAAYDKIHLFDAAVDAVETHRESAAIRPGGQATLAQTPWGAVGLTICYDLRFPALYGALAAAGAAILTVPAAFTVPTGRAHWEVLLRARAIETGSFVLAPAQCGRHPAAPGAPQRETWGHSLAVDPWGAVLADGGEAPGVTLVELDPDASTAARARLPALAHARAFAAP